MIGLLSSVPLVDELCTEMGVCVSRATSSWMYPIPWTRERGEPNAELYLRHVSDDIEKLPRIAHQKPRSMLILQS